MMDGLAEYFERQVIGLKVCVGFEQRFLWGSLRESFLYAGAKKHST